MKSSVVPGAGGRVPGAEESLFSWPIIKVGSGKPRMLYHQRWRSPFRVLVPMRPRRYCLETFSILITTGMVEG
jgi:hypothetical protein